jgi:hypothetical protein
MRVQGQEVSELSVDDLLISVRFTVKEVDFTHPFDGTITVLAFDLEHLPSGGVIRSQSDTVSNSETHVSKQDRDSFPSIFIPIQPSLEHHDG